MVKKIIFYAIFLFLLTGTSIIGFEISCRIIYHLNPDFPHKKRSKIKLDYFDTWRKNGLGPGGYLKEGFNELVTNGYGDTVRWQNNAQGFRYNSDISVEPDSGTIRILSIGDSFTAGYRVSQDNTFSSLLEKYFNEFKDGNKYQVLISCIEDPGTGLFYLSKHGMNYKPDVVLLGITLGNDLTESCLTLDPQGEYILNDSTADIALNPNLNQKLFYDQWKTEEISSSCLVNKNRIHNFLNHFVTFRLAKKIIHLYYHQREGESIYAAYGKKHPRVFDICSGLGFFLKDSPSSVNKGYQNLFRTLKGFELLSQQYHFKFIPVIFPQRFQIQKEDWIATKQDYELNDDCFELTKPNRLIPECCKKSLIHCIDHTERLIKISCQKKESLYFPLGDMHWNDEGHAALFESIRDTVYNIIRK